MNRTVLAVFLQVGLACFLMANAFSVLSGVPVLSAVGRALPAVPVFAVLGVIAALSVPARVATPDAAVEEEAPARGIETGTPAPAAGSET